MSYFKAAVYKAIDTMTLGRGVKCNVGGAEIRLPARLSRFYTADYEPETVQYLRETLRPRDTFFDVGAHLGLFSVLGAKLVGADGCVVSFEPTQVTRTALREVVQLNGCVEIVEVQEEAVGKECGRTVFFHSGNTMSVTNSLIKNQTTSSETEVSTISLDKYVATSGLKPDCIKIDVEGGELDVLSGARQTMSDTRPRIRLSLHPPFYTRGEILEEIWSIISEFSYIPVFGGRKMDRDAFCSQESFFDVNLTPATQRERVSKPDRLRN
jgi:FkbM family methyltransferase